MTGEHTTTAVKVAVNPLPWIFTPTSWDLSEANLRQALSDLGSVGFRALHAEIPPGFDPTSYAALLAEYGFVPAPGYFQSAFEDVDDRPEMLERARAAAADQAALGLTEMFIASAVRPQRMEKPAVGAEADPERLRLVTAGLVAAAEVMRAEGVTAALHPHVGSWVEVEEETRAVLDDSAGTALQFGPDTGHLFWAGTDPAAVMAAYADRIVALHLKDVVADVRESAKADQVDYRTASFERHVWTEPGRGSIDFDAVFATLPEQFAGWAVIEVDVPNLPDRVDSARASFEWVGGRAELQQ